VNVLSIFGVFPSVLATVHDTVQIAKRHPVDCGLSRSEVEM